jgi:putative hydrolase of the HAD superfamily
MLIPLESARSLGELGLAIRAVLFDMGSTLVKLDFLHPGEVYQKVLASLGFYKSLDDVKKAFGNAENEWNELDMFSSFGRIDSEEYWLKWVATVLKYLGMAENEDLVETVHSRWNDFVTCTLYPEVRDVLSHLRRGGLKIGLISNGYEEDINSVLEKVGLENAAFDVIVGVDAIGKMKPHPDIFKYAISKLGVKPEEAVFIGDDVEVDYKGAENASIHAFLVDRTEKEKQSGLKTIRNLEEILSLNLSDFFQSS